MSAEPGPAGPATALPTAARWTAREAREIVCGGAVIVVLALVLAYSYGGGRVSSAVGAYTLTANFNRVDGLAEGADVFLAGIKVGTVIDLSIDAGTYDAVVSMSVADGIKLPVDTVAGIASEGVLGGKYVRLEPGTEKTYLEPGEAIAKTKDFPPLEDQVGEIIFLATSKPESNAGRE
ncbi:MAG: MlaD family protein [Rhodospirillales bacterium]|jgi:phospholipid/cholesterol/gamma-HCH transport system substrate-binding protein|nr:MlaD family protein [Rhodospirillales bacterium]HJO71781.1 MlaD family protein [Rhodospirillales bacterium]